MPAFAIQPIDFFSPIAPPWWTGLATQLSYSKWVDLNINFDITNRNYSTTRFILGDTYKPVLVMGLKSVNYTGTYFPTEVEILPSELECRFAKNGLHFYGLGEVSESTFISTLSAAFKEIQTIPDLFNSVVTLANKVVLLRPSDDVSDVSYSAPDIPFTIFVSITVTQPPHIHLRVAEAIIHECMHLQLTLLEEVRPLFKSNVEKYFSPWKGELRNTYGILHALYVFTVIKKWLEALPVDKDTQSYVSGRLSQISHEIGLVAGVETSKDLTPFGRNVCSYLLKNLHRFVCEK